jgi:hypothetical protein
MYPFKLGAKSDIEDKFGKTPIDLYNKIVLLS